MRRTLFSAVVALALALACGAGVDALARHVESFASDVGFVLTAPILRSEDIAQIGHHLPSPAVRGYQLALAGALIGGIPASVLGIVLAAGQKRVGRRRWSARWAIIFLAGFAFQLSSLIVAALLTWLLLTAVGSSDWESDVWWWAVFLLADVACSAAALPSWRTMYLAVAPAPLISIKS